VTILTRRLVGGIMLLLSASLALPLFGLQYPSGPLGEALYWASVLGFVLAGAGIWVLVGMPSVPTVAWALPLGALAAGGELLVDDRPIRIIISFVVIAIASALVLFPSVASWWCVAVSRATSRGRI
jgi:hypothetical protein